jgi:hypothetical protein
MVEECMWMHKRSVHAWNLKQEAGARYRRAGGCTRECRSVNFKAGGGRRSEQSWGVHQCATESYFRSKRMDMVRAWWRSTSTYQKA